MSETIFSITTFKIALFFLIIGYFGIFVIDFFLRKKNKNLLQCKKNGRFHLSALIFGLSTSFSATIIINCLVPTLLIVDSNLNHSRELTFFSNGNFVGLGGCYIVNNSNVNLKLIGIGPDKDVNMDILSGSIKKTRIMPERYFVEVPKVYRPTYIKKRGRKKAVKSASVYLVKRNSIYE